MKKLMILVAILTVGLINAQRVERNLTPEQIASLKSKNMTLVLDLDEKQQIKVEQLLLNNAKDRKAKKLNKEERSKLTSNQRIALKEQMLEKQIAMKREMRSILNADQYTRWEKMMVKIKNGKKKSRKKKSGRGN
ncbi:hypothetical protein [Nonlabens sp.]|uniref:hypothetical protein n=1 Tax=Nonlabens sp. TaxID=1888209 RepID=UPI003F69CEDC